MRMGGQEDSKRDYHAAGDCDDLCLELMEHLGWLEDLRPLLENELLPGCSADKLRARLHR